MSNRVRFADEHEEIEDDRVQKLVKCKVKLYKVSTMQRCPYIHEMKERLLGEQIPMEPIKEKPIPTPPPFNMDQQPLHQQQQPVATIVKLNADGYGSHTSPTRQRPDRTPLMPKEPEDDFHYVERTMYPKNAKTSLFIIMSFVYAKLLIVICIAYVISDVVTHNLPLYYYEGFFTYLYGMSILFLLYVFCFLLQESTCCSGGSENPTPQLPPPAKTKDKGSNKAKAAKEKEQKKEEEKKKKEEEKKKKEEKERQKKEKKEKEKEKDKDKDKKAKKQEKRERFPRKMRDVVQQRAPHLLIQEDPTVDNDEGNTYPCSNTIQFSFDNDNKSTTYRRNSEGVVDAGLVPVPVAEIGAQSDAPLAPQEQPQQQQQAQQPPVPPVPATPSTPAASLDVEAGTVSKVKRKRKTSHNDQSHGSFFLRIGAIAFGLGTMIYNGLEFGAFFEVPFTSPCYMILQGVNPVLQMIFTFMQMYFIFMNSRLNIHRFKVVARFGLMHVVATNICVWIRTLVLEYIKEITVYHKRFFNNSEIQPGIPQLAETVRLHSLRNQRTILGTHMHMPDIITSTAAAITTTPTAASTLRDMQNMVKSTARVATSRLSSIATTLPTTTTTRRMFTFPTTASSPIWKMFHTTPRTTPEAALSTTTKSFFNSITKSPPTTSHSGGFFNFAGFEGFDTNQVVNVAEESGIESAFDNSAGLAESIGNGFRAGIETAIQTTMETPTSTFPSSTIDSGIDNIINNSNGSAEFIDSIIPQALTAFSSAGANINKSLACGRVNIMGTIVQDSAPYLFPFIIEYSLIGAAVIYVMWKHIGRNPRYVTEEDLEHRLEVMLSRRAVAMAHAQHQGRVDCVGASKGLFFGLLMLVGSLICLILFFVLIHHPDFGLLAIYLADVSHCVLMVLSIIAIIVGFIRVQSLKFKTEEQSDLNDILLRVSAFGLFTYAVFSVIAGHLNAFTREPNLLVMVTGGLSVFQVMLQLLFIADVSRRRVHLPEHDRSKPGRQVVTFLLICNVTMWIIYTFEMQKVEANPVQLEFYGFLAWAIVQRITLPLCIFHRFHSAVTLAEIWKTSYKARLE